MRKISTEADLASALSEPLAVVYKHSPICPTSGIAYEEMSSLRRLHGDAATSPITEDKTNYYASIGLAYRF